MAKNLSELPARTTTADTDLIHVNTNGTNNDYKQTKANFLQDVNKHLFVDFATDSTITSQVDNLPVGGYWGSMTTNTTSTTGMPTGSPAHVLVNKRTNNFAFIQVTRPTGESWTKYKSGGVWDNSWTKTAGEFAIKLIGTISSGDSATYTADASTRAFISIFSVGGTAWAIGQVSCSSGNNCYYRDISKGTDLTITQSGSAGTGKFTVANSSSLQIQVYALIFTGNIS